MPRAARWRSRRLRATLPTPPPWAYKIDKLRWRFGLTREVLVGDCAMLVGTGICEEAKLAGFDWIGALRGPDDPGAGLEWGALLRDQDSDGGFDIASGRMRCSSRFRAASLSIEEFSAPSSAFSAATPAVHQTNVHTSICPLLVPSKLRPNVNGALRRVACDQPRLHLSETARWGTS